MSATPFIKPLSLSGGTFYTFTSATEDINVLFNSSDSSFRFSKFALLNLPDMATPTNGDNFLQWDAVEGDFSSGFTTTSNGVRLANSLQNYALNFERMLTARPGYDRNVRKTVSERVFWKWLKELGGIRWQKANASQSVIADRWSEEPTLQTGDTRYNRVLQYIGEIDAVNEIKDNRNSYSEIYIHTGAREGNTPTVLFKVEWDINYDYGMTVEHEPIDPLNIEVLYGRKITDTHPASLDIYAYFDEDGTSYSYIYDEGTASYIAGNWHDPGIGSNCYFTDNNVGDPVPLNQIIRRQDDPISPTKTVTYTRSKLDGVGVDWDALSYKQIVDDPTIESIDEFATTYNSSNYEFNAVLVYYDTWSNSNEADRATNLFGILFLDNVYEESIGAGYIPRLEKIKENKLTNQNGNGWGFKINIKFDTSVDNSGVQIAVNDFSSFSMEMYMDASAKFAVATEILIQQNIEFIEIKEQWEELQSLLLTDTNKAELYARITELETQLGNANAIYENNTALQSLITQCYDALLALTQGKTSIDVAYNLDIVKAGEGIKVVRNVPNEISIWNDQQDFNIVNPLVDLSTPSFGTSAPDDYIRYLELQKYSNYYKHRSLISPWQLEADLELRIRDLQNGWNRGQKMRISFDTPINLNGFSVNIYTDHNNSTDQALPYMVSIGTIYETDIPVDGKPVFEIICLDIPNTTNLGIDCFTIDILK